MPRVCGPARTVSFIFLAGPTRQHHAAFLFPNRNRRAARPVPCSPRRRPHAAAAAEPLFRRVPTHFLCAASTRQRNSAACAPPPSTLSAASRHCLRRRSPPPLKHLLRARPHTLLTSTCKNPNSAPLLHSLVHVHARCSRNCPLGSFIDFIRSPSLFHSDGWR